MLYTGQDHLTPGALHERSTHPEWDTGLSSELQVKLRDQWNQTIQNKHTRTPWENMQNSAHSSWPRDLTGDHGSTVWRTVVKSQHHYLQKSGPYGYLKWGYIICKKKLHTKDTRRAFDGARPPRENTGHSHKIYFLHAMRHPIKWHLSLEDRKRSTNSKILHVYDISIQDTFFCTYP